MKKLLFAAVVCLSGLSFAGETCRPQGQIIAQVGKVKAKGYFNCVVEVKNIEMYSTPSLGCRLTVDEVIASGVDVGIVNGHDCALQEGDVLTGYLVVGQDGFIRLDK